LEPFGGRSRPKPNLPPPIEHFRGRFAVSHCFRHRTADYVAARHANHRSGHRLGISVAVCTFLI